MSRQHPSQPIHVAIRVRPLSPNQPSDDTRTCIKVDQPHLHLVSAHQTKQFLFDNICFNLSQQEIFSRLGRPCAQDSIKGYNCTIFAYGQTGAGKTYTMMGVSFDDEQYEEHRGLIPRTIQYLFSRLTGQQERGVNYTIRCSYLEIYNEQIIDLLNKANNNLQLREDTKKGVYVQGISEQPVTRTDQVLDILKKGSKSRHISSTIYNEASSRSHSVFTLQIESKYTKNGVSNTKSRQFHFIDLAGSQRTKLITGERLRQGCNINKSLMNLSSVINGLSEVSEGKAQHINYRSSKLTFLLKDSLGGNSKTNLIANVHPASIFYQETLSTLGFARRAKLVKREKASINEDTTGSLQSMKTQIKRLNQQLVALMTHHPSGMTERKGSQQGSAQVPSLMNEFVDYEISKQTMLQAEIAKLTGRIGHLQEGIRQYNTNQIHLRMIISVYEDKVTRLKKVQQNLKGKIANLDEKDQQSRMIIDYFTHERTSLIKMMEKVKDHASNQFIKEMLRQAKVMRQDDSDAALRDILLKNTDYLTILSSKLNQMKPEAALALSEQQVLKRIEEGRQQSLNREHELEQRLEHASFELSEYKSRADQSEKILMETVNAQLSLQEQVKTKAEQIQMMHQEHSRLQMEFDGQKSKLIRQIRRLKEENASLDDEKRQMSLRIQDLCERQTQIALQLQNSNKITMKLRQINNEVSLLNNKYCAEVQNLNACLLDQRKVNARLAGQLDTKDQIMVSLQQTLARTQQQKAFQERDMSLLQEKLLQGTIDQSQLQHQINISSRKLVEAQQAYQALSKEYALLKEQIQLMHQKCMEISSENKNYRELLDHHQQPSRKTDEHINRLHQLEAQIHLLTDEIHSHSYKNQQLTEQNDSMRSKLSKYQLYHRKVAKQLEQARTYKSKLECSKIQMDRIQAQIEDEITSKERLFNEFRKQKEENLSMKKLLQKISQEKAALQEEAKQQAQIHRQLVQKCMEQQKEKRKAASSEHYLKTIQHLQKSRLQQVQLKRQNEELKKVLLTLKESIQQKQAHARDIEHKAASEYGKLKEKLDSLQKDKRELQKKNEQLNRQRKAHEKFIENNSNLKDQIRNLRSSSQKIAQKNEQMAKKIKQANMDSLKLERQYEQIKRRDSLTLNRNDKESYVQRLKAQIAVLKAEKGILTQAVNKEREERSRISHELKCGSGDIKMKVELQKKHNENKNLTELIFQIINQLKISVSEPKTKLEVVRSLILGDIRQKMAEGKSLKDNFKRIQKDPLGHGAYAEDYTSTAKKDRQLRTINLPSNNHRFFTESSSSYKYQKYKDSAAYIKNFSIQNMRDFDKFNARLKYNENDAKRTLLQ